MKSKIFPLPQAGACLVCAAPALAAGSVSLPYSIACALILLLSGCAAIGAVRWARSTTSPSLPAFSAVTIGTALSFGGELIVSAAFPNIFNDAPTFTLTGAPLFFAACFSLASAESPVVQNLCCTASAALLVFLLGVLRAVFSFLPLSGHISAGLIAAGCLAAAIKLLIPEKEGAVWED